METEKTIEALLDELSFLSRETVGASFVIQHSKDDGSWKVVFNNAMVQLKNDPLKNTDFKQALINSIEWVRTKRRAVEVPIEKYTLY